MLLAGILFLHIVLFTGVMIVTELSDYLRHCHFILIVICAFARRWLGLFLWRLERLRPRRACGAFGYSYC
jgi:hypothetical protein